MRDRNPAKKNKKLEKFNKILPTRSFGLSASQSESRSLGHSGQSVSQSVGHGRHGSHSVTKASIFSYRQRLKHSPNNVLLCVAFQYATKYTPFFDIQQNERNQ